MDGREVFDEGGWTSRLGAGRREVGTAMTSDEVSDLTARVSIPALRAYWVAVGQRTVDIIQVALCASPESAFAVRAFRSGWCGRGGLLT
jgi:hypothetical protein